MPFNLDFDICQTDCDVLTFNETTGEYLEGVEECCKTGYGYSTNPTQEQVISTSFEIIGPDGSFLTQTSSGVDLNYLPPVLACASFSVLTLGGSASISIVADGIVIGTAIQVVITPIAAAFAQIVQDLVNSINQGSSVHNYQATAQGNMITICDLCGGTVSNGKTLEVCIFDMTVDETDLVLAGATGNENSCFDFGSGDINGTLVNDCFNDGVYEFIFKAIVKPDPELAATVEYSVTKKFLFDCLSLSCLRELILLASKPNCPCNDVEIHDKIQLHRTNISAANILFQECEYVCANDLIQETQEFCKNICLDCE